MKLQVKIILACLLPVLFSIVAACGISFYYAKKNLADRSGQWLDIRLAEAMSIVKKHENILHKYGLENIPASIAKAKLDALSELSQIRIAKQGYIFVVDYMGVIVSHPDKYVTGMDAAQTGWFQTMKNKNRSPVTIGKEQLLTKHGMYPPWEWFVIAVEPENSVFETLRKHFLTLMVFSAIAVIAIAALLIPFVRHLLAPIESLSQSLDLIEVNGFQQRIPKLSSHDFHAITRPINRILNQFTSRINSLENRRNYYSALVEHTPDLITITNRKGHFTSVSPSAKRIMGYEPNELVNQKVADFIHPSEKNILDEHFRLARMSHIASPPAEIRMKHKDGFWCTIEAISINLLSHPDVQGFVTTARNINRRKSVQNSLQKSYETLGINYEKSASRIDRLQQELDAVNQDRDKLWSDFEDRHRSLENYMRFVNQKIRDDLNTVSGLSRLLPDIIPDKQVQVCLSAIAQAGSNILLIIRNMATLSNLKERSLAVTPKTANIHFLLDALYHQNKNRFIDKPVLFLKDLDPLLPNGLLMDATIIEQVISNLIDLAMDLTPSGSIKLVSRQTGMSGDGHCIDLCVRIEISDADLDDRVLKTVSSAGDPAVQDPFAQDFSSAGLSWFICHHLIHLMGGCLEFKNCDSKTVALSIRLTDIKMCQDTSPESQAADTIDVTSVGLQEACVLIADESSDIAFTLSKMLEFIKVTPICCTTGGQAIRLAQEQSPDLILMSSRLLNADGINTLTLIKQQTVTRSIPVILMMSQDNPSSGLHQTDCDACLTKPVDPRVLYYHLQKLIRPADRQTDKKAAPVLTLAMEPILACSQKNPVFKKKLKKEILHNIPPSGEGVNIAQINNFAARITGLGEAFDLPEMRQLGDTLAGYAHSFDIEKIDASLAHLPGLLGVLDTEEAEYQG